MLDWFIINQIPYNLNPACMEAELSLITGTGSWRARSCGTR